MSRHKDARGRPRGRPHDRPQDAPPSASRPAEALLAVIVQRRLSGTTSARRDYRIEDLPESIAVRIRVNPVSGCWVWTGPLDKGGYGKLGGRNTHRIIWEILVGPVPPKLVLDHHEDWGCLTKACSWPAHLLPVTNRVNCTRVGVHGVAAVNIVKDRCGVCNTPYDLLNTYFKPSGARDCRVCVARRQREYKARERAKLVLVTASDPGTEVRRAA